MDSHIATDLLYPRALTALAVPGSAHDLLSLSTHLLQTSRTHHLEQGRHTTDIHFLTGPPRVLYDVAELVQEGLDRLDQAAHFGKLGFDGRVLNQWLTKGVALAGIRVRVVDADAGEADCGGREGETFRVEVGHDEREALVLFAEEVGHGDFDVVVCDQR